MNTTQINEIIDGLCDRFGTTAEFLIGEMSKYYIAKDIVSLIFSIIFFAIGAWIFNAGWNKYKRDRKAWKENESPTKSYWGPELIDDDYNGYWIVSLALTIISCFIFIITIRGLVGWLVSPTAAFFDKVVCSMK